MDGEMPHKLRLDKMCLEKRLGLPVYTVVNKGDEESPRFTASITLKHLQYNPEQSYESINLAKDRAAHAALEYVQLIFPEDEWWKGFKIDKLPNKFKVDELFMDNICGLPVYTVWNEGDEDSPRFTAVLNLKNYTYTLGKYYKSISVAIDKAGRYAFDYVKSLSPEQNPSVGVEEIQKIAMTKTSTSDATAAVCSNTRSKSETNAPTSKNTTQISKIKSYAVNLKDGTKDVQQRYKMKLQFYAENNSLASPCYTNTTSFKSTVAIDGLSFDSQGFYRTLEEAEHAAAQVAFFSLNINNVYQKDENPFFKNLLQELARKEGFILPAYKTTKTGDPNEPIFFSTVEIEEEKFCGKAAKSEKQAEINAAKAAYIALKKRMSSPVSEVEDESKGKPKDLKREHQGVDFTEDPVNPNFISPEFSVTPKDVQLSSVKMTPPDPSGLSITGCPSDDDWI